MKTWNVSSLVTLIYTAQPPLQQHQYVTSPISILSSSLTALLPDEVQNEWASTVVPPSWENGLLSLKVENDEVVRVFDSNTVKLKRNGLVAFAAVKTPSEYKDESFRLPECMTKSPSSKLRQLLPEGTKVGVRFTEDTAAGPRAALIVNSKSGQLINNELVREGFARPVVRGRDVSERLLPGFTEGIFASQRYAMEKGAGVYKRCDTVDIPPDDQFEAVNNGKRSFMLQQQKDSSSLVQPPNPGDKRGCSDFDTYEDALRWYEKYFRFYGDVAKLDRNNDGVPCPGLPHTIDQSKYRMKVPRPP